MCLQSRDIDQFTRFGQGEGVRLIALPLSLEASPD